MKVLKFGGTSVGTADSLLNVKAIVESIDTPCVTVVSALGGLTDRLIATARMAAGGNPAYEAEVSAMARRHYDIIDRVVPPQKQETVKDIIAGLFDSLKRQYDGVALLQNLSPRTLDVIVSFGERMSSQIVAAMIDGSSLHNSLDFIKTETWYSKNIADKKLTNSLIAKEFGNLSTRAVVPGFISTDRLTGKITNLGRGGSDFTAALIAAALDAEILEIWTDVDGFMTADPRVIPEAAVVPHMTFVESMELCNFGAKVIYPPTIYPVFHKNIPIKILNTFNPSAPGTLITDAPRPGDPSVKGVTAVKATVMFSLPQASSSNLSDRALNALVKKGLTVYPVSTQLIDRQRPCAALTVAAADADLTHKTLLAEFAPEMSAGVIPGVNRTDNLATVAVVGDAMRRDTRLGPRIRNSLLRNSINVLGFSEGNSDTTLSFTVDADNVRDALRTIHGLLF